jgi:hypothetical protein
MDNKVILAYLVYLPAAIGLTFYVARTLFSNGRVFMMDIFKGRAEIADATNKLFEVGFYLLNMGFALQILKVSGRYALDTNRELVEVLASKLGGFSIYLGIMLFLNLYLFFRGKKKSRMNGMTPQPMPVLPTPSIPAR